MKNDIPIVEGELFDSTELRPIPDVCWMVRAYYALGEYWKTFPKNYTCEDAARTAAIALPKCWIFQQIIKIPGGTKRIETRRAND